MREEVKRWIEKSDSDLKTAKYNLDGRILDAAIFYSQQSVEKAFKALLIERTKEFPRIHDLTRLARMSKAPEKIIRFCSVINPGYIVSRYPDQEEEYSLEDTVEIIRSAEEVLKWIKKKLF
ncbi:MAG: HEPN domain-containing protein [archaeon]